MHNVKNPFAPGCKLKLDGVSAVVVFHSEVLHIYRSEKQPPHPRHQVSDSSQESLSASSHWYPILLTGERISKNVHIDTIWLWVGFNLFVLVLLALDLGVFHRNSHAISLKEAGIWSVVWITLALTFNAALYFFMGPESALQFLTGYLIEKSLSVDNIFVFVLLFSYFSVPAAYQHRVLFWGILGALVMRGILIVLGAMLLENFHWVLYLFGAFLIVTGIRMAFNQEAEVHPERNPLLKLVRRFI